MISWRCPSHYNLFYKITEWKKEKNEDKRKNNIEGRQCYKSRYKTEIQKTTHLFLLFMIALCQSTCSSTSIWLWDIFDTGNLFLNVEKSLSVYEDVIGQFSLLNRLCLYYFSYILRWT